MSALSAPTGLLEKYRSLATQQAIPLQASLELTYRCNERCTHCYIEKFWDDPKKVLGEKEWHKVLSELRMAGTLYIILMGGEAMLSPHFWFVLNQSAKMGFHTSMISNGLKIQKPEVAERLAQSGLKRVTVSVYSLDNEIHDRMTSVKGSLDKTLRAIDLCHEQGIEISVNSLLTEANAAKIFDLHDWAMDQGFDLNVDPNVTAKLNGDLAPTKLRAQPETLKWFYQERTRRWPKSAPRTSKETQADYVCNVAKGKCAVNPYGELLGCIEVRESLGSLVTGSFEKAWMSETALKWRNIKVGDVSGGGDARSMCDHCPGMTKNETGDSKTILPFSEMIANAKKESLEESP